MGEKDSVTETSVAPTSDFEQLKLLFEYTKFHIGLYAAIITIFSGLIAKPDGYFKFRLLPLQVSIVFICIAGFAGGVIISSITQHSSYQMFWRARLGPLRLRWFIAEEWTYIEHLAFWVAVILALFSFVPRIAA